MFRSLLLAASLAASGLLTWAQEQWVRLLIVQAEVFDAARLAKTARTPAEFFRLASLLTNGLFWALLGVVSALGFRRFCCDDRGPVP